MSLLDHCNGLITVYLAAQELRALFVSQRRQSPRSRIAFHQALCFLDQTFFEHEGGAPVKALVEQVTGRVESDFQDAESDQRIAPVLPELGQGPPGGKA